MSTHRFVRSALGALAAGMLLTGCSLVPPTALTSSGPPSASSTPPARPGSATTVPPSGTPSPATAPAASELPRGGRELFPRYRLFGYAGYPGAPGQGRLGTGDLEARMNEIEQRGRAWRGGRELLPVMELIAVTVHGSPGADGMYRTRAPESVIKRWHDVATEHRALLLLNIQPGRARFIDEVKHFEKWLKYPDVGVALDPEWAVGKGQVPGRVFGSTAGKDLNDVATYLSGLTTANNLPEKVMLFHQLHVSIVKQPKDLKQQPGLVYINAVDGIGSPGAKVATFRAVMRTRPSFVHAGFKLFFTEDVATGKRLMTAAEVLGLKPQPEYILFE
ncbi:MAG: hypothetical protein QM582_10295 [Micropruina sp.]|uniref:hypothetical protein n=1 Tax=Micropruina sp. TaxID=2737536 RepID=UPI0039E5A023